MIDSATLAMVPDSRERLKWKVPIAGMEYPNFAISESLDLQPSYKTLRMYLEEDQKGKAVGGVGCSTADPEQYVTALGRFVAHPLRK
ncbi:hypothetical protein DL769_009928 [Monosporascus sp. CRB-8-3]|nr:hypothetical protein DL769_009928 [Monosporascus sp. CRB-8-3]